MNRRNFLKLCTVATIVPSAALLPKTKQQTNKYQNVLYGKGQRSTQIHVWNGSEWELYYQDYSNSVDETLIKQLEEAVEKMKFSRPAMLDIIGT